MPLSYKKPDVYRLSIEFPALSLDLMATLPKGHAKISDEFKRASMSIPLNIAEAAGRASPSENSHHFSIARGSAMECGAILDVLRVSRLATVENLDKGDRLLDRIVSMLSKLCRS